MGYDPKEPRDKQGRWTSGMSHNTHHATGDKSTDEVLDNPKARLKAKLDRDKLFRDAATQVKISSISHAARLRRGHRS